MRGNQVVEKNHRFQHEPKHRREKPKEQKKIAEKRLTARQCWNVDQRLGNPNPQNNQIQLFNPTQGRKNWGSLTDRHNAANTLFFPIIP